MNTVHHGSFVARCGIPQCRISQCRISRCRILTAIMALMIAIHLAVPVVSANESAQGVEKTAEKVEDRPADTDAGVGKEEPKAKNGVRKDATVAELSVAPLDQFEYPDDRPKWLHEPPQLDGDVHHWVVVSSPAETRDESVEELGRLQRAALMRYVEGHTENQSANEIFAVTDQWIEDNLITDRYVGEVKQGDTLLYEDAVKLTFDKGVQSEIAYASKRIQVRDRLAATGVLVAGGLCCLMIGSLATGFLGRRVASSVK